MVEGDLGTGLIDTLNNGLKLIIEQLDDIANKLENIEKHIELANEAVSTIIDALTTQQANSETTPIIPGLKAPPSLKKTTK